MAILVCGSLNMDLVVQAPRFPAPGETLLGQQFLTVPGGKGANQAVAAARQQIPTAMIGRVGNDDFGKTLRQQLAEAGVDVARVQVDNEAPTGVAAIVVSQTGDNQIIVVPGANGEAGSQELASLANCLATAKLLLLQFEIPIPTVVSAARMAHAAGVTVVVDPAPAIVTGIDALYSYTHILTPNQVEAAQLVGFSVNSIESAHRAAQLLHQRGVETVLVKLGERGVVGVTTGDAFHVPAFVVQAVDTVAAGDAFNSGLAAALHQRKPLREAVTWAAATAALSVMQPGAQPSMPSGDRVAAFLKAVTVPNPATLPQC